jgi:hypothetical protein
MELADSNKFFSSVFGASALIRAIASYHVSSRSQSDNRHSVELLRKRDQFDAGTSTTKHTTLTRDRNGCTRLDSNLQFQENKRPLSHASDRPATEIGFSIIESFH